jgi:hypothetical protein
MAKRVYKDQVIKLINTVSKMAGGFEQFHNLRKKGNNWKVDYFNASGTKKTILVGATLEEVFQYFLSQKSVAQWHEKRNS